ncbi:MAG: radical SAM protein [Candidatus Odinarchaeota archaeon]
MSSRKPNRDILRLKVALLTWGVHFPSNEMSGRTGGAGPTLGSYFLLNDGILVNAPVRTGKHVDLFRAIELQPLEENQFEISFEGNTYPVQLIAAPKFYQNELSDGTPMSHIALVHGTDCLATTIVQHCDYFDQGLECQFCSIPVSLEQGKTVLRKSPEQFLKVLKVAKREKRASHFTLTMGTPDRPDRGVQDYVEFVSAIRKRSDEPIHVQLEPPESVEQLRALKDVGVDTVGIHLEIYDDDLRKQYCPGKFHNASFFDYYSTWRQAVRIFGRGQVSTFILLGLGETSGQLHQGFKTTIEIGVIPVPVPCRPNPGSHLESYIPPYVENLDQIVDIYLDCAQLLYDHQLDPRKHRAGCVRCRGCTALTEAYQVVEATQETKR